MPPPSFAFCQEGVLAACLGRQQYALPLHVLQGETPVTIHLAVGAEKEGLIFDCTEVLKHKVTCAQLGLLSTSRAERALGQVRTQSYISLAVCGKSLHCPNKVDSHSTGLISWHQQSNLTPWLEQPWQALPFCCPHNTRKSIGLTAIIPCQDSQCGTKP